MKQTLSGGISTMDYLERLLQRLINDGEGKSPMARSLRDQIAAQERGQSAQEMYITGMMKREPERAK
jgi:hypothetical protein